MKNYSKLIAFAASAVALTSAAKAADYTTSNFGDLILGFYAGSGTGALTNVEVNLGEFTAFDNKDGATFTVAQLSVTDLTNTYGSGATGWNAASRAITWGVVGTVDQVTYTSTATGLKTPSSTLFITAAPGVVVTAANTAVQGDGAANITSIYSGLTGFFGANATAGSNINTAIYGATADGSWTQTQNLQPSLSFAQFTFDPTTTTDQTTLKLYELVPTSGNSLSNITEAGISRGVNLLGSFNLANDGTLTFTAIPEPSSYAAIAGVMMLGVVAARRRRTVKA